MCILKARDFGGLKIQVWLVLGVCLFRKKLVAFPTQPKNLLLGKRWSSRRFLSPQDFEKYMEDHASKYNHYLEESTWNSLLNLPRCGSFSGSIYMPSPKIVYVVVWGRFRTKLYGSQAPCITAGNSQKAVERADWRHAATRRRATSRNTSRRHNWMKGKMSVDSFTVLST